MKPILVVGSLVEDLISQCSRFPESGETIIGDGFSKAPGGKGANQAVQAARLGCDVSFFGATGDDPFSRELIVAMRDAGIDTTKIKRFDDASSGASGVSIESIQGQKCNRIIMNPGANFLLKPSDVEFLKDRISDYSMLILQFEIPLDVDIALSKMAHEAGVVVFVNPAPSQKMSPEFLSYVDWLTPNEHEAFDLTGIKIENDGKKANEDQIKKCGNALLELGVKNVVITLGGAGSVYMSKSQYIRQEAVSGIAAVDPTAAGDSFIGSLASSINNGLSVIDAMKFASYASALTVTRLGAMPSLPSFLEVASLLEDRGEKDLLEKAKKAFRISKNDQEALADYVDAGEKECARIFSCIKYQDYSKSVQIIEHSENNGGRVHITGIGKPSHVAEYMASLLSSTGTPTYYLHGTEAVHGSCGQLLPGDVVIAISNSGETTELKATLQAAKNNGCKIIGVSGGKDSWLASFSDAFLLAHADIEGGPINKAPRCSILSEIIVLQALSVILQSRRNIKPSQYVMWHPGGKLGESIKTK